MSEVESAQLRRAYSITGPDDARSVYDDWALTYDKDLIDGHGYVAPTIAARRLAARVDAGATVLDAGCGTGLQGAALAAELPGITVDGVDISQGMLDQARRLGVYRDLTVADLTGRPAAADAGYDAVICVGTLTGGHVGPSALEEFARVVRPGGAVVATVNSLVWESGGYRAHLEDMAARGRVAVIDSAEGPYHENEGITGRYLVLQVR